MLLNKMLRYQDIVYIVLAMMPWLIILAATGRGFDLTDESFYLLNYTHPEHIHATLSLFGVVIKPLFYLTNDSLVGLRILGLLLYFAAVVLTTCVTARFFALRRGLTFRAFFQAQQTRLVFLLPITGGALYYRLWLLTPSYNWLTLLGLLLFWVGFLLWLDPAGAPKLVRMGAALFAFSAAVVFWSKPSSAILLVFFPLGALSLQRESWKRYLYPQTLLYGIVGVMIGLGLPLLSGYSPQRIYDILTQGIEFRRFLVGESTNSLNVFIDGFIQFFEFMVTLNWYFLIAFPLWLIPLIYGWITTRHKSVTRQRVRVFHFVLGITFSANLVLLTLLFNLITGYWLLNILIIVTFFIAISYYTGRSLSPEYQARWFPEAAWAVPVFLMVFVFIFGSSNEYAFQATMAGYFFLLSTAILFMTVPDTTPLKNTFISITVPVVLLGVLYMTIDASLNPYRQDTSVWAMNQSITIRDGKQPLRVSYSMAAYLTELQQAARQAGFQAGTPIIDLTGQSPGVAYALEGHAYGFPWLLGGSETADEAAIFILNLWEQEDLERAWVLTAIEDGDRSLSVSVLASVGLDFPTGYCPVAMLQYPNSEEIQVLWRPIGNQQVSGGVQADCSRLDFRQSYIRLIQKRLLWYQ